VHPQPAMLVPMAHKRREQATLAHRLRRRA
jgi:hypothetical protein